MKTKVLVVEDEPVVVLDLRACLQTMGYEASFASNGEQAVKEVRRFRPNVVLMDIKLKNSIDGIQTATLIQQFSDVPVVFLTGYADPGTVQRAAAVAPDGYIVKPFKEQELAAVIYLAIHRLRYRTARRSQKLTTFPEEGCVESERQAMSIVGRLCVDHVQHCVLSGDRKVNLTPKEFAILEYLMEYKGYPIHPEFLLRAVWGPQFIHYIQALRVHIKNLRKKLTPESGVTIEPVRGVGYRLVETSANVRSTGQ